MEQIKINKDLCDAMEIDMENTYVSFYKWKKANNDEPTLCTSARVLEDKLKSHFKDKNINHLYLPRDYWCTPKMFEDDFKGFYETGFEEAGPIIIAYGKDAVEIHFFYEGYLKYRFFELDEINLIPITANISFQKSDIILLNGLELIGIDYELHVDDINVKRTNVHDYSDNIEIVKAANIYDLPGAIMFSLDDLLLTFTGSNYEGFDICLEEKEQ